MRHTFNPTVLAFSVLVASLGTSSLASAQGIGPIGTTAPAITGSEGLQRGNTGTLWQRSRVRPFISTKLEVGYVYLRPRVALGYGRAEWLWAGVETYTALSSGGIGEYGGLHGALGFVDFRIGARYQYATTRTFLRQADFHDHYALESRGEPAATYYALEAELSAAVPVPYGSVIAVLTGYSLGGVPQGYEVFDESLHVVVRGQYVWRARVGYVLAIGQSRAVRIGVVGEVLGVPERPDTVVRAGVILSLLLAEKLEVLASFVPVLNGRDNLGLAGGDFGQLGLRYRWASGLPAGHDGLLEH